MSDSSDLDLRSVHTSNFPALLEQLGISLVLSTYQAGKLIVVRHDGGLLNTHFRPFNKPMGLAVDAQRLCLGTAYQIWELRNIPAVAPKLEPLGKHDACYLPRQIHVTGDIDIHEMAIAQDRQLWFVNTRFSCLCTLDLDHSFVPRWRPPFVSAYDLSDRCHLNGLSLRDSRPRYVTALGATDSPEGWRAHKAAGGILMDIERNEILAAGLSMPHSPRWYDDRLWVLESGKGSLAYWSADQQQLVTVAELPGFTRGLDFYGPFAFVGLSQVRESAAFSGLPLTQTRAERYCGLWVIDCRSGETLAFLRFEAAVQEIFAVGIVPSRFPEILLDQEVFLSSSYVLPEAALAETLPPDPSREFAQTHFERGNQLYREGDGVGAIAAYRRCLELQLDFLPARYQLGVALGDQQDFAAAESELRAVLAAEAGYGAAYAALGRLYEQQGRDSEAIAHYEQALQLEPDQAQVQVRLAALLLRQGAWERGWTAWAWRLQLPEAPAYPHPRWEGRVLPNQALLLTVADSEIDEAILFARFIPLAAARCSQVVLACPPALQPLLATLPGVATRPYQPQDFPSAAIGAHLPLLCLPSVLRLAAAPPAQVPYLRAEPERWPLPGSPSGLRVGLAGFRAAGVDVQPLVKIPGCTFYGLPGRLGEAWDGPGEIPQDLTPQLQTYAEAAAAIAHLDLVISLEGAIAHLAGALGKPAWVLLPPRAHWCWSAAGTQSPWYPTLRLLRQAQSEDWGPGIAKVAIALQRWLTTQAQ